MNYNKDHMRRPNKTYSEKEMAFWPAELVQEYDQFKFNKELNNINKDFSLGEATWDPSLLDAFRNAVNGEFQRVFPFKAKISWDAIMIDGDPHLVLIVKTENWGSLSANLPVEKIKSKKCPKSLPQQLVNNFITRFEKKRDDYESGNIDN